MVVIVVGFGVGWVDDDDLVTNGVDTGSESGDVLVGGDFACSIGLDGVGGVIEVVGDGLSERITGVNFANIVEGIDWEDAVISDGEFYGDIISDCIYGISGGRRGRGGAWDVNGEQFDIVSFGHDEAIYEVVSGVDLVVECDVDSVSSFAHSTRVEGCSAVIVDVGGAGGVGETSEEVGVICWCSD